jgi:hypothetical protein
MPSTEDTVPSSRGAAFNHACCIVRIRFCPGGIRDTVIFIHFQVTTGGAGPRAAVKDLPIVVEKLVFKELFGSSRLCGIDISCGSGCICGH